MSETKSKFLCESCHYFDKNDLDCSLPVPFPKRLRKQNCIHYTLKYCVFCKTTEDVNYGVLKHICSKCWDERK